MENHGPDDPVAIYIREASNVEPLTKDEETKLFQELAGSEDWDEARENVARRLIEAQLAQVVRIAQKHSSLGAPMLDLIQEGNIGLMNAVRRFAESPIGDFTDYAATCIEDAIKKAFGIDWQKFAELLVAEFPQLRDDVLEWSGLLHLQMMEFYLVTEKAINARDWATVERCLRLADTLLRDGDGEIRNAIHVSYLENLPREGDDHDRIRGAMTPDLRKAWDDILAYLSTLRDNA